MLVGHAYTSSGVCEPQPISQPGIPDSPCRANVRRMPRPSTTTPSRSKRREPSGKFESPSCPSPLLQQHAPAPCTHASSSTDPTPQWTKGPSTCTQEERRPRGRRIEQAGLRSSHLSPEVRILERRTALGSSSEAPPGDPVLLAM